MEYVLALMTLVFGFICGRIHGAASSMALETALVHAVYRGEEVVIAVGDKAVRTRVKDGKVVTEKIVATFDFKEDNNETT